MKNLILTLAIGFLANVIFAHPKNHNRSELNLKLHDNGLFSVILDNQTWNLPMQNFSVKVKPGKHSLKVVKHYSSFHGNCAVPKIIFNGIIHIPPKSQIFALIDLYSNYDVYSVVPFGNHAVYDNDFYINDCDDDFIPATPVCANNNSFLLLKNALANEPFDSKKLIIAKQAIAANGITSQQVLELMEIFSFESYKLKLTKFAYAYTFDKQNYFLVSNGFTFSSSVNELNKFIGIY